MNYENVVKSILAGNVFKEAKSEYHCVGKAVELGKERLIINCEWAGKWIYDDGDIAGYISGDVSESDVFLFSDTKLKEYILSHIERDTILSILNHLNNRYDYIRECPVWEDMEQLKGFAKAALDDFFRNNGGYRFFYNQPRNFANEWDAYAVSPYNLVQYQDFWKDMQIIDENQFKEYYIESHLWRKPDINATSAKIEK
jgi:hypothetical protein